MTHAASAQGRPWVWEVVYETGIRLRQVDGYRQADIDQERVREFVVTDGNVEHRLNRTSPTARVTLSAKEGVGIAPNGDLRPLAKRWFLTLEDEGRTEKVQLMPDGRMVRVG